MKATFKLPSLPFSKEEIIGVMSAEQLEYHYEKHHLAYVDKANELIDAPLSELPTGDIIQTADAKLKQQVSQIWNHTFFWHSLTEPSRDFLPKMARMNNLITEYYGDLETCRNDYLEKGKKHFASGWLFLTRKEKDKLDWVEVHDGGSPFEHSWTPLICVDLWEHAYYVDYRNDREKYLNACFGHLNWEFAERNLRLQAPADLDSEIRIAVAEEQKFRWLA